LYWQLAGFYFFYFAYLGAFAPYFSLYLDAAGYGAAAIGVLMTLPQVVRIFAPHLWGYLADRSARRVRVALFAGMAGTACFLGVFFSIDYGWLFACIALWSFFWSAALPLMESTTLNHLDGNAAGYGRIRLWGSIGFIAAVVGVGWILDHFEISLLLSIVALLMAGILACAARIPEGSHESHGQSGAPIGAVLRRPEVVALIVSCFLMAVAHGPYYTFFSIHLAANGYSKTAIGWLWAIGVIAEIAVFAWMPALQRVVNAQTLLVASFAIAVLRFVLIGALAQFVLVLILAQLMHAATFGTFHSAALGRVHGLFRGPHQARGQAVYSSLSFGLGGTLGGLGSGWAWESLGPAATFVAAGGCALLGFLVLRFQGYLCHNRKLSSTGRES
jgi:PPP family 3-phenylpropionic acid transporter